MYKNFEQISLEKEGNVIAIAKPCVKSAVLDYNKKKDLVSMVLYYEGSKRQKEEFLMKRGSDLHKKNYYEITKLPSNLLTINKPKEVMIKN